MTDNRTTELLRKLLEERGVSCQTHYLHASWYVGPKLYEAMDNLDGTLIVDNLTPEQAIAATLGETYTREDVESAFVSGYSLGTLPVGSDPQWDENRQTVDEHMAELGWVRSATLGSGALTAEQVREAWCGNLKRDCLYDPPTPDWQAIADELNARAERTCKFVSSKGSDYPPVCSACGYELGIYDCEWFDDGTYGYDRNYCPNCGARVEVGE